MEILKANNTYKAWSANNPDIDPEEKLIARAILTTNDVSATLFITQASFEKITDVYNSLYQENEVVEALNPVITNETSPPQQLLQEKEESESRKRLDRKKAVGYVMSRITKGNPGAKVVKVRYGTMDVQLSNQQIVQVRVGFSRDYIGADYNPPGKICCSWHKEDESDLTSSDYRIYVVECDDSYKALIFSRQEISNHVMQKNYTGSMINYYFHWNQNGTVTDEREVSPIDVTPFDADKTNWVLK